MIRVLLCAPVLTAVSGTVWACVAAHRTAVLLATMETRRDTLDECLATMRR